MSIEYTPIEVIPEYVSSLRDTYHSGKLQSIQFQLNQLRNLLFAMEDNLDLFCEALELDFNKSSFETRMFEYYIIKGELIDIMKNLSTWLKPKKPYLTPLAHLSANIRIEKIAYGVVMIVAPFNYPLMLGLSPIFGAIAGGNCVLFKPSEQVPHFTLLLTKVLTSVLDNDIFKIVNGDAQQMTLLLDLKFDLIFFTGSPKVGKIVAKAAAETLTPVVLELGGKSPAVITKNHGDLDVILSRLVWGKFINAGQTCVAVDYILCDDSVKLELIKKLKEKVDEFYPDLNSKSEFSHIINDSSFKNLKSLLDSTKGDIIVGGATDPETRFFEPTIVSNVNWDDSLMGQELFGPILPIVSYSDLHTALEYVSLNLDCPLALYIYSNNSREVDLIKSRIRSGGVGVNDNVTHVGVGTVPFGGIGSSGYGNYHGRYSIDLFTHERTVFKQPIWAEILMTLRYPPVTKLKQRFLPLAIDSSSNFKRNGDVPLSKGFVFYFLGALIVLLSIYVKIYLK